MTRPSNHGTLDKAIALRGPNEISLIFFQDFDLLNREKDELGFNKIGYATEDRTVLHPVGRSTQRSSFERIERFRHLIFNVPFHRAASFDSLIQGSVKSSQLLFAATQAVVKGDETYFEGPPRLPIFQPLLESERSMRWKALLDSAQPADMLFSCNPCSYMSRLIAWVDAGVWSHTAMVVENHFVVEALPGHGVCKRPLGTYSDPSLRLGLFRPRLKPDAIERAIQRSAQLGGGYSYVKAGRAGLQKLLAIKRTAPTPNDLALRAELQPICLV